MPNSLVIGLGSMGKRRIRCLRQLGKYKIFGVDLRLDRREEVEKLFNIKTFDSIYNFPHESSLDFAIIALPPDQHIEALHWCTKFGINSFVEASVILEGLEDITSNVDAIKLIKPSCTLLFHPAIQILKEILKNGKLGKISNIILHSGQYLPYWHKYESVADFYVSKRSTGGARELVPFELTWVTHLFGMPMRVGANYRKTINIDGAEKIDDTYNILLDFDDYLASITIDVVSKKPSRRILINGSKAQFQWDWENNFVEIMQNDKDKPKRIYYDQERTNQTYYQNISELMYLNELKTFIDSLNGHSYYPNTLIQDVAVLKLLQKIELSNDRSMFIEVN